MDATENSMRDSVSDSLGDSSGPIDRVPEDVPPDPARGWLWFGGVAFAILVVAAIVAIPVMEANGWIMLDLDVYRWGGGTARVSHGLYHDSYGGFLFFTYTP